MSYANQARVQHLLDLNRAVEARDLARTFVADDPRNATMLSLLADAENSTDGPAAALATIERALSIDHENSSYHAQRGYFLSHLGEHDEAEESFTNALSRNPTNTYALSANVEAILRDPRTNRRRHKATKLAVAESRANVLLSAHPSAAISHLMDAKVRLAKGDFPGCDASARRALKIEPDNSIGHQLIGLAAEAMGHNRAAGDAYVNAQRADPTSSTGIDGLRRLGKGAAAPIGFGLFLALRLGVQVTRHTTGIAALALAVTLIGVAIVFIASRRKKLVNKAEAKLSSEARSILEQDRKLK